MEPRDIIVVGTSAGGIEAVCSLIKALPRDLPASMFVVQHIGTHSSLAEIFARCGTMEVISPGHNEKIQRSRVYVAPADFHMQVSNGHIELSKKPRENRHRPSVDALFRSAARNFRERVVAVILSGALDDGAMGAFAVKTRGGCVIVQDPKEAAVPDMPRAAMRAVEVDYSLPIAGIAALLVKMATQEKKPTKNKKSSEVMKAQKAKKEDAAPVPFTCPECNGPLFPTQHGNSVQFACIVGHAFSPESFTEAHREALERSILTSMRMLKERAAIHKTIADKTSAKDPKFSQRFEEDVASSERDAALLQEILDRL